ncbi:hypothetical protein E3P92_02132 [Wallemia ichthyophaga]|uniref:HTH APSES-type domain-containing protein n=2 Tax=Wallemia ichthyophaga TaxID=245174 RepID=A0A4T0HGE7_WALIC|nr:Bouquet formation protein 4 [Wallemia ichthyophaga EXF-994]TIA72269.1 hypothetical protein E3P91_02128 [Wallemia ichthyophaga]EOR00054.1 Bouquet formation protein 4 [Wallemia ichthyophaga EXF-994]TIA81922.1 hypothetical protein E3P98_01746 [Wallemia ichthyophaga]TIA91031.1 hypothetical protein E3P97_02241 [Wallemia ichthyophaga]TIA99985.1 hypothetical protein E3P95_01866 [Wallemia ichthyophaga]
MTAPVLPNHFNDLLDISEVPTPKWQQITRDDRPITIARLKLPHPREKHTFVLRRYDCNGISFGSLFKAAFPYATDEEEKNEFDYVKKNYDVMLVPTEEYRDTKLAKLAGFWIPIEVAQKLGKRYAMEDFLEALIKADKPDLTDFKKRSSNRQASEDAKSSPAKAQASLESPAKSATKIPTPTKNPAPRRSARHQSRSPSPSPLTHNLTPGKKKAKKAPKEAVIEESLEETVTTIQPPSPMMHQSSPVHEQPSSMHDQQQPQQQQSSPVHHPAHQPVLHQSSPLKAALNDDQVLADIERAKDLVDDIKQSKQLAQGSPVKVSGEEVEVTVQQPTVFTSTSDQGEGEGKRKRELEDETGNEIKVVSFGQNPPANAEEIQERPIVQRRGVAAAVGAFALGFGFAASNILPRFLF